MLTTDTAAAQAPQPEDVVYVVEDDSDTREALSELLSPSAKVKSFASAEEFLNFTHANGPACLLLDEQLPGMSGSELLQRLHRDRRTLPTVFVTAYADTPLTVNAMRHGATTVLDKPCGDAALRRAVAQALNEDRARRQRDGARRQAADALAKLSDSEREVLRMVLDGTPNKQIARRLGVCVRTVEARRSKIYKMTGVTSVAGLVRLCLTAGFIEA